ncbi:aromatase/cyclase [Actinokineospora sp. G85]|uniref:aromatase/cyclase n=1 Tax=Actinokineospora sp. G85 TaxID=3406626 RepID=UPI003C7293BC
MATPAAAAQVTRHEVAVDAPAEAVYRLLADTASWPWALPTSLHLEPLETTADGATRVAMHTVGEDGSAHTWVALRRTDPAALTVSYRQERSWSPVADMGGEWVVEPRTATTSVIRSAHDFRPVPGAESEADWIRRTLDGFATAELSAFAAAAGREHADPGLRLVLCDSVRVSSSAEAVHAALWRAEAWPSFLPHVRDTRLTESDNGAQLLEADIEVGGGKVLTTRVTRVGYPARLIVFKHLVLPPIGAAHLVRWTIDPDEDGVLLTAEQTVVFDPEGIAAVLGDGADLATAREFATNELSANSRAILEGVRDHVQA